MFEHFQMKAAIACYEDNEESLYENVLTAN